MQNISQYFQKAGLNIYVTDKPIGHFAPRSAQSKDIFQMTIDAGHPEQFRIFKGQGNDVRVLDYDKKKEQVLLFVKEPKRTFTSLSYDPLLKKNVEIKQETPDHIRRYLMGMDERHYFISELPDKQGKINSIDDAHRVLKPSEVKDRVKHKKDPIQRQGEWFFVAATPAELLLIDEKLAFSAKLSPLQYDVAIGTRGKPHTAQYLLRIDKNIFIKGTVRHVDHAKKTFSTWQRVFRNTENIAVQSRNAVLGWID